MLIDSRTVPEGKTIQTDVCIIGAGAAGITLAREFISQPFRVCLLESGDLASDEETQSLYAGEVVGLPYIPLDVARLRFFGGTTNHWNGWCQPLDEIDFESRDWIPYSGWPFSKSHLVPFYERAQSILQLGPFAYGADTWQSQPAPRLPFKVDRVITKMVQFSSPTRFGRVYRDEIAKAGNIRTFLNANVIEIETTENGRTVTRLHVACLQGKRFWVSARLFILATGGIENARLLLLSNKVEKGGLGNENDLVGRFFMDHAGLRSGLILTADAKISTELYRRHKGVFHKKSAPAAKIEQHVMGELILSPETMHSEKLPNFCAVLEETSWLKVLQKDDFLGALRNVITNINEVAMAAYRKFIKANAKQKLFRLYNIIEPIPNPDSRVTLTTERDMLGQNRMRLDLRWPASEKSTITRAHQLIGAELGRAGLGRFKIDLNHEDDNWPPSPDYGRHHMGTTRMHVDPLKGVVDPNCQVHGIANLFIAGSSVFSTYGYAQPTLTIVALALRLADHVKRLVA